MGLLSSLALSLIPLLRRDSSTTPTAIPIDSETTRLEAEVERLRVENDRLRVDILMWMDLAEDWRRRAESPPQVPYRQYQALQNQAFLNQALNQARTVYQQQYLNVQIGGQNVRRGEWYHCDCTPRYGRAGFLRGDN